MTGAAAGRSGGAAILDLRMNGLVQRLAGLAAVALAATVIPLALTHRDLGRGTDAGLPRAVGWTSAVVAPYGPTSSRTRTACGLRLTPATLGISHPVLPCGAKIFLSYHGTKALTQVVDHAPGVAGRSFDVTVGLARKLGLRGSQRVRWAYAR